MQTIFDFCRPRQDVIQAQMRGDDFATDLSKVVRGNAPPVEVTCNLQARMSDDGMARFEIGFDGTLARATTVKSLVERPLQSAKEESFDAGYRFAFKTSIPTDASSTSALIAAAHEVRRFRGLRRGASRPLKMAIHRKNPRRVLAALRPLLTSS